MEAETETEPLEVHLLKQEVCEFVEPESEPPIRDNKDIQFECQVKNEPLEEYEYEEEEECNTLDYDVDHSDFKVKIEVEENDLQADDGNDQVLHKCPNCAESFTVKLDLQIHYRSHLKDRMYKCSQCPKAFTVDYYLQKHLKTHLESRPFKCTQCPKTFVFNSHLRTHMRLHTGERPFKCTHCPKSFIQSSQQKAHIRSHTNDRPFKCSQCPKAFKIAMPKIVVRECETIKNKISVRQQGKTSTERSREFRERKKALKNAASQGSIITKTKPKTAAERSRDYRARKRQKYEKTQESNYQQ
ncbi:zinc finger protein 14-like isoform X1 [Drosophila ficusphila]|uniref:zinc finger protein 14-like isoform X1 n=1 Tax=Drosophila ficusphila TaxID=30025 RepID=UPI0007E886AF|nr:zinc finger protein 14-like isoform X1 [Drosophila ficusphila]